MYDIVWTRVSCVRHTLLPPSTTIGGMMIEPQPEPRALSDPPKSTGPLPCFTTAHSAGCVACPLSATRTHIVDGSGPYRPDLMVIGEAPGSEEDKAGVPFVGQSGKLLRATLGELGLAPERVWFTNAVKCRPPDNRNPEASELEACSQWLQEEIDHIRPRAILCVGKIPSATVGSLELGRTPVFHAFHPAFILRSRHRKEEWKAQLRAALPHGGPSVAPGAFSTPVYEEADPWLSRPWIAVDTETDQADPDDGGNSAGQKMVCFQVSDGRRSALYLPDREDILEALRARRVFVQGAKFDLPLLGIPPRRLDLWDDTQLMAYVLREDQIGLKPQALKYHNLYIPPIQSLIGTGKKRIPFSQALKEKPAAARDYAMRDAFGTALLAESQTYRLADDPTLERYYEEIEKPTLPLLLEMEQAGITIDVDALEPLDALLKDEILTAERAVQAALGVFNIASGDQLARALADAGFDLSGTTRTGKVSTDEAALLKCLGLASKDDLDPSDHRHAIIGAVFDVRSKKKLRTTYVQHLRDERDADGRIHARFNQCVANTNRLSSSKPNLQNIPIRGPIKKTMRRVFKAKPGHVLVKADYSQLELRIYAEYTGEKVFVDAYAHTDHDTRGPDGACLRCDVHQQVAFELSIPRFRAKNTIFAANYGADGPKLAATAGVPSDRAVGFLGQMRSRVPSLLTWPKSCAGQLSSQGYIETLLGWRMYFPAYWSPVERERREAVRQAANGPIQGTAAGLVKKLMILVDEGLAPYHDARLLLQVHDEVVYEVPLCEARQFAADLESLGAIVGEVSCDMRTPLKLEVQIGLNWGDMAPWHSWDPGDP